MNDETRLAFAHPLERAKASSISTQYDRISLRDHIVEVEIGAFQLERGVTRSHFVRTSGHSCLHPY